MDIWVKAGQLMLSLSILVILHEFGHYIPAKLFKTRVEKFYLFFNPWFSLFKKKVGDTEWGIGWLPLGGFVKIAGMVDESMDKEQLAKPPQPWEFRSKKAWQRLIIMIGGVTVNIIVGVLIYIFVVYAYGEKQLKTADVSHGLSVHPYMEKYGLKSGDLIVSLDGEELEDALDANVEIMLRGKRKLKVKHEDGSFSTVQLPEEIEYELFQKGAFPIFGLRHKSTEIESLTASKSFDEGAFSLAEEDILYQLDETKGSISVIRESDTIEQKLPSGKKNEIMACFPAYQSGLRPQDKIRQINKQNITYYDNLQSALYKQRGKDVEVLVERAGKELAIKAHVSEEGRIGFLSKSAPFVDEKSMKQVYYSFGASIGRGFWKGYYTMHDYAAQLKFLFTKKGASSIGGFGSMGKLFPSTWNWKIFWLNTALISIILAFMNILPIPALDGGHVVFLIYEMITGKEAPQKILEYAQYVGIILLLGLMLYANGNDIYQAFFK
ncbi:MAG: RIP metalloprotease RseP [Bacteroidetes bacterium]|nr:MAG: RIP metalloprotease RseP [Bacteroidota bacterium]